jgi:hypothetical protein
LINPNTHQFDIREHQAKPNGVWEGETMAKANFRFYYIGSDARRVGSRTGTGPWLPVWGINTVTGGLLADLALPSAINLFTTGDITGPRDSLRISTI